MGITSPFAQGWNSFKWTPQNACKLCLKYVHFCFINLGEYNEVSQRNSHLSNSFDRKGQTHSGLYIYICKRNPCTESCLNVPNTIALSHITLLSGIFDPTYFRTLKRPASIKFVREISLWAMRERRGCCRPIRKSFLLGPPEEG